MHSSVRTLRSTMHFSEEIKRKYMFQSSKAKILKVSWKYSQTSSILMERTSIQCPSQNSMWIHVWPKVQCLCVQNRNLGELFACAGGRQAWSFSRSDTYTCILFMLVAVRWPSAPLHTGCLWVMTCSPLPDVLSSFVLMFVSVLHCGIHTSHRGLQFCLLSGRCSSTYAYFPDYPAQFD